MTRWLHPPERASQGNRAQFDPVSEGAHYRLSREASLAVWKRACGDVIARLGWEDPIEAAQRFHHIAVLLSEHGGRLIVDVGRTTRVAVELNGEKLDTLYGVLARRTPGRRSLAQVETNPQSEAPPAGPESAAREPATSRSTPPRGDRPSPAGHTSSSAIAASTQQDASTTQPRSFRRPPMRPAASVNALFGGVQALRTAQQASERALGSADRATQIAEVVRLDRTGELTRTLRRGTPGAADAVAAALQDRAIFAPHPVDQWRSNVRELRTGLTLAGHEFGQRAAQALHGTQLGDRAARAFDIADRWTGGAARTWTARARGWADGAARRAMADRERDPQRNATRELAELSTSGGEPLSSALRARMEALFGHRFAHVRVHTDDAAARAADAAGARAVTIGSHIYFNLGQFAPGSEAGDRLLLHELTHVVQHDQGQLAAPNHDGIELSTPSDPAEQAARAMESRVGELRAHPQQAITSIAPDSAKSRLTATPTNTTARIPAAAPSAGPTAEATAPSAAIPAQLAGPSGDAPRTGRRASRGVLSWVGDRLDDVANWAEDKIESLVEHVAPELMKLIKEGPTALIQDALQPAISGWVGSLTGGVNVGQIAGDLKGSFSSAFAVLEGAKAGDAKCCETLIAGIDAIRSVANAFIHNPVMDAIRGIFSRISDIVESITKLVLAPAFDILKSIVGGAWDAIQAVASTIQGWIDRVRRISSRVFDWVAKKLGFSSGTGEGGLLDWLKQKASELWTKIKQTLQPVIGPLKVVAGVMLMFTGLPEIYAIIKYGPQLVEAVQWLWANRNNPEAVKQNPHLLGGTILPKILGVGQGFVDKVKTGAAWLVDKTSALATGALQLAGAITGIPLLSMAQGFARTLADGVKNVQTWAVGAFTSAEHWLEGLYHRVADFIKPYAEVLCSVATAATNPAMIPVILAGWAWRWLPDCIKPPLIDLLLDAVIGVLEHAPSFAMLGPLWPLLKAGVLGFLHAVRAKDPATKIKVSNKLAKIISGASPLFLLGFVKGLLRGVWDGIKMPFEAIYLIVKGIGKAGDFFVALGNDAEGHAGASTAPAPAKTTTPAPAVKATQPLPAVPSQIQPDQASAVVQRIAGQLNASKPPRPAGTPPVATTPAPGAADATQYRALGQEARRMGGELLPPMHVVTTGFMPAVHELFSGGGKGMTLNDLMAKLHKVWVAAQAAVSKLGAKIANMICDFFVKDSAEEELGDTVGYLVGMVAFQALVDAFSVGAWSEVNVVLTAIAKFLNWPMMFFGEAMKAMKLLGGYIVDGIKGLGSMVAEAGSGALHEVIGAFREIAGKLGEFADELMAKFGKDVGKADSAAAHTVENDAAKAAENDAGKAAANDAKDAKGPPKEKEPNGTKSAAEKEAQKAEELAEAEAVIQSIKRAAAAGHVPGPALVLALEGLKSRYTWIQGFGPVGVPAPFELMMYASEHDEGRYDPGIVPTETPKTEPDGKKPLDPGGRGKWGLEDAKIDQLPKAEADELRALQTKNPPSEDELRRLVELRKKAGGDLSLDPGTPEHTLDRWEQYKTSDRPKKQDFKQWMNGQPSRMANSAVGNAVEDEYRAALKEAGISGKSSVDLSTGQRRQIDILVEGSGEEQRTMIQIKSGEESLTTEARQSGGGSRGSSSHSNEQALKIDQTLAKDNRVIWVFEDKASGPLLKRALESDVEVVVRVDSAERAQAVRKLMERAEMSAAAVEKAVTEGKLIFVEGDRSAVIDKLAKMLGGT